jgi:hypothetical protein
MKALQKGQLSVDESAIDETFRGIKHFRTPKRVLFAANLNKIWDAYWDVEEVKFKINYLYLIVIAHGTESRI